ncbi:MFS transporter [Rhodococcus fascians]|nr:MFS transporter [Rhodococcus fascians]MBY3999304.1 MFS transporter [Rhodococcus fascians]MBY4003787.1 MFS transporter [Rhodococcus fascians]MBY4009765.1 MFS transporter [Rhodococcus fascians]MBY4018554.1 MFS transporter [Rhodococcus fascians]
MPAVTTKPEIETRVVKKVARRIIPFLGVAYFVNYLDRTNIGLAKLTMSDELGLTETMFGLASGLFFIGYLLFEVPSNLALHKFGARRWIARIMVSWGIVAAAMAFVPTAGWLYGLRIVLGIAEAGFFPGVLLYMTMWFPRAYRVRLMGLFMLALPVSSALGAPLSSAIIQYWDGLFGLSGWRVMFLFEGLPAIVLGVITWFYLTDRPSQATWLDDDEKNWLTAELESEGSSRSAHVTGSVKRALTDARVWMLGLVYFGITYGLYSLSFFLPSIVAGFKKTFDTDFSLVTTGLIVAVPFAVGALAMVLWSRHSDRTGERTWHVAIPTLIGAVSIPVALYMDSPFTTMIAVTVNAVGVFCALPVFWYLPSAFHTGAGAAAGIAIINSVGNLSGFGAPYVTGWLLDATGNAKAGLWVVGGVMMVAVGLVLALHRRTVGNSTSSDMGAPVSH